MKFFCVLILAVLGLTHANDKWNDLKVTWGVNPFGSNSFVALPRTVFDARSKGWTAGKGCADGVNGNRYTLAGDRSVILLFNKDGNIAGMSSAVPKNLPFNFPSANVSQYFNDEGDSWLITAYFADPLTICGTTKNSLKQVTGDRLVFQSKQKTLTIALKQSDLDLSYWSHGKCFWTMGDHYWANLRGQINADMDADYFLPIFLLYNKGELNGWGWAFNADLASTRFEHPGGSVLGQFFQEVPKFFNDPTKAGVLSTMHVYLSSAPQLNFC
jgi:charged multivesicular body protein 7